MVYHDRDNEFEDKVKELRGTGLRDYTFFSGGVVFTVVSVLIVLWLIAH